MTYEAAEQISEVLKALAHPVRLQIVDVLEDNELCVGQIMEAVGGKQAITSQQLNMMRTKGVLASRRDANKVYYTVANPNVIQLLHCMHDHCDRIKDADG